MEEHKSMLNIAKVPQNSGTPTLRGRYFKVQIRAWTDFDPMDKKLPEISEAIEGGGGFLTAIEVLEVEDDVAAIRDNEVREGFQNILAAQRVLRSIGELPKSLVEHLRSALNVREELGDSKPVSAANSQSAPVPKQA
jgi:hypothetical protein